MQHHTPSTNAINAKSIAKYTLLPGVLPRLNRLARHFSEFMFIFTQLFGTIGLIDKNHPCMNSENIGAYRFKDIFALALSNVVLDREHLPQTIMFGAIVMSLLTMVTICVLFLINFLLSAGVAHAQFFGTPKGFDYTPNDDWALQFLTRIFGNDDFFVPATGGNMWFTALLTGMLKHYSMAMLVIAAFMVLYLMVITMTEAARTGKPFGTRFDSIWAPIRMALAIGLLIPISSAGYNGAQMIVFQSAKWGSNLASNTWFSGLQHMGKDSKFFSATMSDPGYRFVRDIFLINLCVQTLNEMERVGRQVNDVGKVKYFSSVSDEFIVYTFGPEVAPDFCGQVKVMTVPTTRPGGLSQGSWPEYTANQYQKIAQMFLPIGTPFGGTKGAASPATGFATLPASMSGFVNLIATEMAKSSNDKPFTHWAQEFGGQRSSDKIIEWVEMYWSALGKRITSDGTSSTPFFVEGGFGPKIDEYNKWLISQLSQDAKHGWTTAGVFYLRMSSAMGDISKIVSNPPVVTILPANLAKPYATADNPRANTEQLRDFCNNFLVKAIQWLDVFGILGQSACNLVKMSTQINEILVGGMNWFAKAPINEPNHYALLGGTMYDRALDIAEPDTSINVDTNILTQGLFEKLGQLARIGPTDLHPLATVVTWGYTMLQISMWSFILSIALPGALKSMALTLGTVFLLPGFILAFWIPMQPFLYFMFAVVEWMISVLEAIIGMPLWALSLISLEGDGLGKGMNGVKMIFEIVLRPTIIVMSLLASVIVFTAAISFFNNSMSLYAGAYNAANKEEIGMFSSMGAALGMVFIYMFGIYSLATSCFKLIDAIPDKFGRWGGLPAGFGSGIKTGMAGITNAIIGGMLINQTVSGISGARGKVKEGKKQDKADKESKALNARLSNIESRLP